MLNYFIILFISNIYILRGNQWHPQLFTTIFLYFFKFTLDSSKKYSTDIGLSLVGAQHGFGTCNRYKKTQSFKWIQRKTFCNIMYTLAGFSR